MSEHAVKAIDKVQTQKDMIRVELKKSLDPVDNGFNSRGRPNPELEGSEQARESTRREKAEGKRRGSAEENLRNGNGPNTSILLLGRDEPAGQKPGAGDRINAPAGNVLQEGGKREKKKRIFC